MGGKLAENTAASVAFSTVSGGAVSELTGGNFWQGAATAFYVSALNHAAHKIEGGGDQDPQEQNTRSVSLFEKGDVVLPAKETLLGRFWATIEPRVVSDGRFRYTVDADGQIIGFKPLGGLGLLEFVGGPGALKAAAKTGTKLFGKEVVTTTSRMGRDGKAVEVIFKDGSKIDINAARVKQWTPNTHPNAPAGTLQKVKFDNSLPGSKGYKRTPTQSELDFLNGL